MSNLKHGDTGTKIYKLWASMRNRCKYKTHSDYKNYGARGITVCDEWVNSYVKFKDWALRSGYKEGLTIERVNNNAGYSPENCAFVEKKVNCQNKRRSYIWHIYGKRFGSSYDAAHFWGVSRSAIDSWCGLRNKYPGYYQHFNCYRIRKYPDA